MAFVLRSRVAEEEDMSDPKDHIDEPRRSYLSWRHRTNKLKEELDKLHAAVKRHHDQIADDRCRFDDDELYAAFGLPPADYRVGDKAAMLENCKAFIEKRCDSGFWRSYQELLEENKRLLAELVAIRNDPLVYFRITDDGSLVCL